MWYENRRRFHLFFVIYRGQSCFISWRQFLDFLVRRIFVQQSWGITIKLYNQHKGSLFVGSI